MSEGNWSENGCQVGVSRVAQCNSQHFGTQWESKIGLSENNLHRFRAGVDVEVQTLKMAFFWEEEKKERPGRDLFVVRSGYQPPGTKGPVCRMCPEENADFFQSPRASSFSLCPGSHPPCQPRTQAECGRILGVCWLKQSHQQSWRWLAAPSPCNFGS